jgi:hypothetical protein
MDSKYVVDLLDPKTAEPLAGEFLLRNSPIHHPDGRDIAITHFEDEKAGA